MDGPNIERLFLETDCLTAQSNLEDICRYLRFFKGQGDYQAHLAKYLPKLAKPEYKAEFNEFIGDLEDKDLAKQLKATLSGKKEDETAAPEKTESAETSVATDTTTEAATANAVDVSSDEVEPTTTNPDGSSADAPKKRGRKPKVS